MDKIIPKCKNGEIQYISSKGRWFPCCSFPNKGKVFHDSIFSRDEYKLDSYDSFIEFDQLNSFQLWLDHIESNYNNAPYVCKDNCSKKQHDRANDNENFDPYMEELFHIEDLEQLQKFIDNVS